MSRAEDDEIARISGDAVAAHLAIAATYAPSKPALPPLPSYRLSESLRSDLRDDLVEALQVLNLLVEPKDFRLRNRMSAIRKRLSARETTLARLKPHYRTPPATTDDAAP